MWGQKVSAWKTLKNEAYRKVYFLEYFKLKINLSSKSFGITFSQLRMTIERCIGRGIEY